MIKLTVTVRQMGKKVRSVETTLSEQASLETCRKIFECEQTLNSIPGSTLRWHFSIEEVPSEKK